VHRHPDEVRPPALDDLEVGLAPVAVSLQLVGIGDVDAMEGHGVAVLVDEAVALDVDELQRGLDLRCIERLGIRNIPPVSACVPYLTCCGQQTRGKKGNRT